MPNSTLIYELSSNELLLQYNTDPIHGLSAEEAHLRNESVGLNQLQEQAQESVWSILLRQLNSLIVWILAVAGLISFLLGDHIEGYAILAVILINAVTGFVLEFSAQQSMQALKKLDTTPAHVIRDGKLTEVGSEYVTTGDILILEAGDLVPADASIIETNQLEVDESALTGESLPSAKSTNPSEKGSSLGDQHNRLFKGTAVTNGNAKALVTAIGAHTELGKIATLVGESRHTSTPLETKLHALSKVLLWVTAGLALLFLVAGLIRGEESRLLIETAIALAIAAIPEGMSVVATIALAYGMLRLAKRKVIVKRLSAVETLGGTNVVFTDKTGTLTQNKITVHSLHTLKGDITLDTQVERDKTETIALKETDHTLTQTEEFRQLALVAALANNAQLRGAHPDSREIGDPVEIALLKYTSVAGLDVDALRKNYKRIAEKAFSSDTRIMGTLHQYAGGYLIAAKGAIEEVSALCHWNHETERKREIEISEAMAADGLRTLAFAYREAISRPSEDFIKEHTLTYLGLVGFQDPARSETTPALKACKAAGIKVIMVTGDHPATSLSIAKQVQMVEQDYNLVLTGRDLEALDLTADTRNETVMNCRIFARVSPSQKLDLIGYYQKQGAIVGMTGDGVNDAPALKKSDIGIAMGLRGTAVAAEASDMVLKDDSFSSIVYAIGQGRVIFENIRKFIVFLMSCNMSEIFVVTFAGLIGLSAPLLPLQILFLNIITDVFPALALGVGKENDKLMHFPPRDPNKPILQIRDWRKIVLYGLVMTTSVLGVYWYAITQLRLSQQTAGTITFYALSLAQLLHVFNLHSGKNNFLNNEITRNKYIWFAILLCILIMLVTYYTPVFNQILSIGTLDLRSFQLIILGGILPLGVIQLVRAFIPSRNK